MAKKRFPVKMLARLGLEAGLYFVLTFFMPALSYGPLQFRVGEALTLLPVIFPESVLGVTLGCLLANVFSPYAWYDMVFGTLATLVSAILTRIISKALAKRKIRVRALVGAIPPILVNAIVLPLMWYFTGTDVAYWVNFGLMLATQSGTILVLGVPLVVALSKTKLV